MAQAASPIYFKGFNGVRFIAASAVIVHHIEEYKAVYLFGRDDLWARPFVYQLGRLGVALFFVLSGFLITYLLLAEKQKTGTIAIRKFYIRRVLRIWPLYFLIVGFVGLATDPDSRHASGIGRCLQSILAKIAGIWAGITQCCPCPLRQRAHGVAHLVNWG
mgnify:CR=1 FL=1